MDRAIDGYRPTTNPLSIHSRLNSEPSYLITNSSVRYIEDSLDRLIASHSPRPRSFELGCCESKMEFQPEDVKAFAGAFSHLTHDPKATRSIHLQAGGFVWSDETPDLNQRPDFPVPISSFMIALISYRSTLIRGAPHTGFAHYWNAFLESCPTWPGFRPERSTPNLICELDSELNAELLKLERILKICNRRRARKAGSEP